MAWLSWSGQFCPPHRLQVSWSGRTLRELPARLLFRSMRCPAKGKAGQGSCASMPIPCISRRQSISRLGARSAPHAIGQGRWFAPDKPALSMRRSRQPLIDIGDVGRHQSFAEDGDYHRPLLSPEHLLLARSSRRAPPGTSPPADPARRTADRRAHKPNIARCRSSARLCNSAAAIRRNAIVCLHPSRDRFEKEGWPSD
jgi:hypothetical protein